MSDIVSIPPAAVATDTVTKGQCPCTQLTETLAERSGKSVLEHCLGLETLSGGSSLAKHMVVVCIDTESQERNHSKLTEIGSAIFEIQCMNVIQSSGAHGENLLNQAYFYHARIEENTHLVNIDFCVGHPEL
jgi:hypothetical protein